VQPPLPYGEVEGLAWRVDPSYGYRPDGQPGRTVKIFVKDTSYKGPVFVKLSFGHTTETAVFQKSDSLKVFTLLLPPGVGVDSSLSAELTVSYGQRVSSATLHVSKKKQWTVYIYPHSHLDIGYTALPADVKKLQLRNIDVGIDIAAKTQHNAKPSRFTWNPEATWVVRGYLEQASPLQKQQFIAAVKKGWVQVDGGFANSDLTTMSDEQLIRFFQNAAAIQKTTGTSINTMVQMDLPGAPWGLVTVAAEFGIKRFISFPNTFDLRKEWEHKPFYWLGPDGKTKMLFLQGFPYGIGYNMKGRHYGLDKLQTFTSAYDRVSTSTPLANFLNPFIFEETADLEAAGSPYDIFAMTWSMADNCVIDADLPEAVKQWNNIYAYPKLVIAGAGEILDAYEKKYASIIPTCKGEFTEFWTNGLGSDAKSVGAGRIAKEKLVEAEILSAILPVHSEAGAKTDSAWEDELLSAEHTWGAQNSHSEKAKQIEKIKSGYFAGALAKAEQLINDDIKPFEDSTANGFSIINTLSWPRTGIVTLSRKQSRTGNAIVDEKGGPVPAQRLSTGELIFEAEKIPAFGSNWYKVVSITGGTEHNMNVTSTTLQNDLLILRVDAKTGNIISLKRSDNGYEYVDSVAGLNRYEYLPSLYNGKSKPGIPGSTRRVSIRIKESGPLLVSLLISADAEMVSDFTREVRLYKGSPVVDIINSFIKIPTTAKEGIHIGFGFQLPGAIRRMDMPWSIVSPNTDQLEGSNKNWFSFQRWVDISTKDRGITWTAIECPLIEWGNLSGNILDGARQTWLWQKKVPESSELYSWVLNNHWDTNFPLQQGGSMQQHYSFVVHNGYDVVAANRFGMEAHRPLITVQAKHNLLDKSFVYIGNPKLFVSTIKKMANSENILLRIRSVSDKPEKLNFDWPAGAPSKIVACSANGEPEKTKLNLTVAPYGMKTVMLNFDNKKRAWQNRLISGNKNR
jgi:alpha-mannosidase